MSKPEEGGGYENVVGQTMVFDLNREILTRWNEAITHVQQYQALALTNARSNSRSLVGSVYGLFLMVRSSLRRDLSERKKEAGSMSYNEMIQVFSTVEGFSPDRVVEVFEELDKWLYEKNLTKVDTKRRYDRSRAEISNKVKGL